MAESFDFTEEEIRRKLEQLGYSNIPSDKLKLFQRGLLSLLCRFNERALIYFMNDRSVQCDPFWVVLVIQFNVQCACYKISSKYAI